jgi:hypothetical protein
MHFSFSFIRPLAVLISFVSAVSTAAHAESSCEAGLTRAKFKPKKEILPMNETDLALWQVSNQGDEEVGVIELLDANEKVLAATRFVRQRSEGQILKTVHVPIQEEFISFLDQIDKFPHATRLRFTHVHPKALTSTGTLYIAVNWIFSPGDIAAGYTMKFMLEKALFENLSVEMGLVYQPPFAKAPRKKRYIIPAEITWDKGYYSVDRRLEVIVGGRRR